MKRKIVWRAYENDGVELSSPNGCETKEEARSICREEWQYTLDEMGYDPGFDFYIEQEEITDDTVTILQALPLKFKKGK